MKKRIIRILSFMLAAVMLCCFLGGCSDIAEIEDENAPLTGIFTNKDVKRMVKGFKTVGDYIDAIDPIEITWEYEPNTGLTSFTVINFTGWVQIKAALPEEEVNANTLPAMADVTKDQLSETILNTEAQIWSVQWNSPEFADIIPFIRGIGFDATISDVRAAYLDKLGEDEEYGMLYDITELNEYADESWAKATLGGLVMNDESYSYMVIYTWCDLKAKDDWKEYDRIVYCVNENVEYIRYVHLNDDASE